MDVDGVMRPVGTDGEAVDAVGRRLERRAGDEMAERLRRLGDMPLGGAFLTPGGGLPARFVLHLVVRSPEQPIASAAVRRALVNALGRADDWDLASLALPPLGLGAGTLEPEAAAALVVDVLRDYRATAVAPPRLTLVVGSAFEEELFARLLDATGSDGAGALRGGGTPG
jgi:serine/threonine-protein kinase